MAVADLDEAEATAHAGTVAHGAARRLFDRNALEDAAR
jgi:hypothetical protein